MPIQKNRITIANLVAAFKKLPTQPPFEPFTSARVPITFPDPDADPFAEPGRPVAVIEILFLFAWDGEAKKWVLTDDTLTSLEIVNE